MIGPEIRSSAHAAGAVAMQRLSSRRTFLYRWVLPLLWLLLAGGGVVFLAVAVFAGVAPSGLLWAAGGIFLLGAAIVLVLATRLSTVHLINDCLRVHNFGRSREIPLSLIESVHETRFINPKMIRIRCRAHPGIPEKVTFLAPMALQIPFGEHPVVRSLRQRVGINRDVTIPRRQQSKESVISPER